MASQSKRVLNNGQLLTSTDGPAAQDLPAATKDLIGYLNVSAINAATTLDVKIQHSPDNSTWFDLGSAFTQLVGVTGNETVVISGGSYQWVRMSATLAGATQDATFVCELYYDTYEPGA